MYLSQTKERKDSAKPNPSLHLANHLHKRSKTGFDKADLSGPLPRQSKPHPPLSPPEPADALLAAASFSRSPHLGSSELVQPRLDASRDPSKSVVRETKLHKNRPLVSSNASQQVGEKTGLVEIQTTAQGQQLQFLKPVLPASHSFVSRTSLLPTRFNEKRKNTVSTINRSDASTPIHRDRPKTADCSCLGYSRCVLLLESMDIKEAMDKYEAVIRKLSHKLRSLRAENDALAADNGRVKKLESLLVDQRVLASHQNKNHELSRLCMALCSKIGYLKAAVLPSVRSILEDVRSLEVR